MIWLSEDGIGSLVPNDEALVSVEDRGFLLGHGAFETIKITGGVPFALERHLARLASSLEILGLPQVRSAELREAIAELMLAEAPVLAELSRLRVTVTAGRSTAPTIVITVQGTDEPAPSAEVITVPGACAERSPIAGAKSTSYAAYLASLRTAHAAGASEAVLGTSSGLLCEGSVSNVFLVREGRIITPSLSSGCLPGITRQLICEWFDVAETDVPLQEFIEADEAFLTSSLRDVQPITAIDRRPLAIGQVTKELAHAFRRRAADQVEP